MYLHYIADIVPSGFVAAPAFGANLQPDRGLFSVVYTLLLVVCLSGSSSNSCEVREQIAHDLSAHPGQAFIQAQALVAQWTGEHPGYVVQRWSMKPGRGA
jgi:hypothetical protein